MNRYQTIYLDPSSFLTYKNADIFQVFFGTLCLCWKYSVIEMHLFSTKRTCSWKFPLNFLFWISKKKPGITFIWSVDWSLDHNNIKTFNQLWQLVLNDSEFGWHLYIFACKNSYCFTPTWLKNSAYLYRNDKSIKFSEYL